MKFIIKDKKCFDEMLKNNEIKKEWSELELYGVDAFINVAFQDFMNEYEEISVATIYNKGVLEANLYNGIVYNGIHADRAYIHNNNDIVLMSDFGTKILIIKNDNLKVSDFYEYYHPQENISK